MLRELDFDDNMFFLRGSLFSIQVQIEELLHIRKIGLKNNYEKHLGRISAAQSQVLS